MELGKGEAPTPLSAADASNRKVVVEHNVAAFPVIATSKDPWGPDCFVSARATW